MEEEVVHSEDGTARRLPDYVDCGSHEMASGSLGISPPSLPLVSPRETVASTPASIRAHLRTSRRCGRAAPGRSTLLLLLLSGEGGLLAGLQREEEIGRARPNQRLVVVGYRERVHQSQAIWRCEHRRNLRRARGEGEEEKSVAVCLTGRCLFDELPACLWWPNLAHRGVNKLNEPAHWRRFVKATQQATICLLAYLWKPYCTLQRARTLPLAPSPPFPRPPHPPRLLLLPTKPHALEQLGCAVAAAAIAYSSVHRTQHSGVVLPPEECALSIPGCCSGCLMMLRACCVPVTFFRLPSFVLALPPGTPLPPPSTLRPSPSLPNYIYARDGVACARTRVEARL